MISQLLYNLFIFPVSEIIEIIFTFVYRICWDYGWTTIALSFAVTILTLPLYAVAERWQETERNKVKQMAPQVARIKHAFSGDERFMILSTYYRQNHYHPIYALRSAFGLLIQIPFFMAAYSFLSHLKPLEGLSFAFIPDMGSPDGLIKIGTLTLNFLPIAMTAINIVSGMIYTKGFPIKEKVQLYGMAGLFLILLYDSPAGLVLYWTMNNVLSLVKNVFYKCKNPLRAFHRVSCYLLSALTVGLFATGAGIMETRLLIATITLLVCIIPIISRKMSRKSAGFLSFLDGKDNLRFWLFLLASIASTLLVGLVIPANLIGSSPVEFSFIPPYTSPLAFVLITFTQALGAFLVWPICLYFLFSKKTERVFAFLAMVSFWYSMINTFLFAGHYRDISIVLNFSDISALYPTISSIIQAAGALSIVIGILYIFFRGGEKKCRIICHLTAILIITLLCLFAIKAFQITKTYSSYALHRTEDTKEEGLKPIFHLSTKEDNVVLIMLDRGISGFLPAIFAERPDWAAAFDGFTYYPNTTSFGTNTLLGSPSLFGGYSYTPRAMQKDDGRTLAEKHNEALKVLPRLFDENGFAVTLANPPWTDYSMWFSHEAFSDLPDIDAENLIVRFANKEGDFGLPTINIAHRISMNLLRYAICMALPQPLRLTLYDNGDYLNEIAVNSSDAASSINAKDYAELSAFPALTDFTGDRGLYMMFNNELTHSPFPLQAPDYILQQEVTNRGPSPYADEDSYGALAAAIRVLASWLTKLKENGAYDNTRIIIASDHGYDLKSDFPGNITLPNGTSLETFNAILMAKDLNEHGPMATNDTFMTLADVPAMAAGGGIVKEQRNPYTGLMLDMEGKRNGADICASMLFNPGDHGKYRFKVAPEEWLHVHDDVFNASFWSFANQGGK